MADTLRQRVSRVIAGGAHALLDKIEDAAPVAILEQSVREVESFSPSQFHTYLRRSFHAIDAKTAP
jgi:hypothetical protein